MSPLQSRHRRFLLGTGEDSRSLTLGIRGRNILIAGDTQSGKSWVAGSLCEQLILHHYSVCIIDPEGDYATLEGLPGVLVVGGDDPPPQIHEVAHLLRHSDVSVVLNLSKMRLKDKRNYTRSVLSLLLKIRRAAGIPHWIVVDEAHYFLQDSDSLALLDPELAGYILITYRVSSIHSSIRAQAEAVIVTSESDPGEIRTLRSIQGGGGSQGEWESVLRNLARDEAVLLPGAGENPETLRKFRVAPRLTNHVRHRKKYLEMPVPEGLAFVFSSNGRPTKNRAQSLKEFIRILTAASPDVLDGHLRRNDFSRWIGDVFKDANLAQAIHRLESQYVPGTQADTAHEIIHEVELRYDPPEPT